MGEYLRTLRGYALATRSPFRCASGKPPEMGRLLTPCEARGIQ